MYSITTQQIEAFLTIAKYVNLSRAAETMYISQPALSKILQRFEERIGVRLFVRGNQGLSMTAEGAYLAKALEPLYGSLNKVFDAVQLISNQPQKSLRLVHTSIYDVAEIFDEAKDYISRFANDHPDIELSEWLCEYRDIRNAIEFGNTDVAMVYDFVLHGMKNVSYKRITAFPFYLAMSRKHPLAAQYDEMPPGELLADAVYYRVGFLDEETSTLMYEEDCRQAGFMPRQFVFVPNMQTLFHCIRENKGMSLCTRFTFFGEAEAIKYYKLPPFREMKHTVAAWRTDKISPEAKMFIDTLPGEVRRSADGR